MKRWLGFLLIVYAAAVGSVYAGAVVGHHIHKETTQQVLDQPTLAK